MNQKIPGNTLQIQKGSSYLALRQLKRKLKLMMMSGCGFAFDKGFCYRRIFITAGGFLLLITISQRQGPFGIPYKTCLTTLFIKPYSDADSLLSQFVQVLLFSSLKVFPIDSPLSLLLQVKPNISLCRKHEYGKKIAPILFV